jgi:5-methylcytosine-specific restriction endonuclease McrA
LRADNKVELVKLPWTLTRMFTGRWALRAGRKIYAPRWPQGKIDDINAKQADEPCALLKDGRRVLWYFHERFYWDDDDLLAQDVMALVLQKERSQDRKLQSARSLMRAEQNGQRTRPPIPRELRLAVFERDGGKCVECDSSFDLQYDHILPFAHGGATNLENLQLPCGDCNRAKSDHI